MDMGHSHGSGGTTGGFKPVNMGLAQSFWYIIVGFVGLGVLIRIANYVDRRRRLRACANESHQFPTRPTGRLSQAWATATAIAREISYPQLYVPTRFLSWLTPPPLGRVLLLLAYWAVIIYMMAADAIIKDIYFWERIGFRNAWVTMMQVPLLYLLASKANVVAFLLGSSHERLNWMHRWVARTMLVTGAVHGWHFYHQWALADFVEFQLEMMPMVKYGLGAWAVLAWALLSSFAPLRHAWYELFVAQHVVSAAVFLWLLYVHVPATARWYLWLAVASLCLDRFCRLALLVWQNVKVRRPHPSRCKGGQRVGHQAQLRAVGDAITVVTIKDVHFRWRAGQHLYLWIPRIGPLEAHPYTVACAHQLPDTCICNSIQLVVRRHAGFSRRLHAHAARAQAQGRGKDTVTVFVSGPYGAPPRWDVYETLVLISASTGASFTLPILESVIMHRLRRQAGQGAALCTKRVDLLLAAKRGDEIDYYVQRLHEFIDRAREAGIELKVVIAMTQDSTALVDDPFDSSPRLRSDSDPSAAAAAAGPSGLPVVEQEEREIQMSEKIEAPGGEDKNMDLSSQAIDIESAAGASNAARSSSARHRKEQDSRSAERRGSTDSHVHHMTSRPDIASFIRGPVEAAGGETSVVVCGGKSLVATVRNCVAALSDERAVHKGTGAQGIHLHVEEYSF